SVTPPLKQARSSRGRSRPNDYPRASRGFGEILEAGRPVGGEQGSQVKWRHRGLNRRPVMSRALTTLGGVAVKRPDARVTFGAFDQRSYVSEIKTNERRRHGQSQRPLHRRRRGGGDRLL